LQPGIETFFVKSGKLTGVDAAGISYILDDPLRKKIERTVFFVFFILLTFSFAFLPDGTSWGVAAGGSLSLISFINLRVTLEKVFEGFLHGRKRGWVYLVVLYYLKLAVMFVSCFFLLKAEIVGIFGLAVGLFVVPAAMIYAGIYLYVNNLNYINNLKGNS